MLPADCIYSLRECYFLEKQLVAAVVPCLTCPHQATRLFQLCSKATRGLILAGHLPRLSDPRWAQVLHKAALMGLLLAL
jgi:hypothetical protein